MHRILTLLCIFGVAAAANAEVRLTAYFGDHMVLQRETKVPVWGMADPGERVSASFNGQTVSAQAGPDGKWEANFAPMTHGGPFELVVKGDKNTLTLTDVLVGDVWLFSGQSNCGTGTQGKALELAERTPQVRFARQFVPLGAEYPLDTPPIPMAWEVSSTQVAKTRTAIGGGFLPYLNAATGIPQGFVAAFRAGTAIEPWIPLEGYDKVGGFNKIREKFQKLRPEDPAYKEFSEIRIAYLKDWIVRAKKANAAGKALPLMECPLRIDYTQYQGTPTALYNEGFAPMAPMALKGMVWYQGESNVGDPAYSKKLDALAAGLRKNFRSPNMVFYIIQPFPFKGYGSDNANLPILWEQEQDFVDRDKGAQICVSSDHGDIHDWHPTNKEPMGIRLSNLAMKYLYGKTDLKADFPRYLSHEVKDGKFIIAFRHAERLSTSDGKAPNWFELAGKDGKYYPAESIIDGNKVILSSKDVSEPVKAHFAWSNIAEPNLRNEIGLPCGAFRTDRKEE